MLTKKVKKKFYDSPISREKEGKEKWKKGYKNKLIRLLSAFRVFIRNEDIL